MARAMDIVDVFKALLDGGCICEKIPPVIGKIEYDVLMPTTPNCAANYIGHITERQYLELYKKNIIALDVEKAKRGKTGNLFYYYYLAREAQHENP